MNQGVKKMNDELQHYGIKGMKWGVRRFQPYPKGKGPKGRFLGKEFKNKTTSSLSKSNPYKKAFEKFRNTKISESQKKKNLEENEKLSREKHNIPEDKKGSGNFKKAMYIAIGAAVVAGVGYMTYKHLSSRKEAASKEAFEAVQEQLKKFKLKKADPDSYIKTAAGEPISWENFRAGIAKSKQKGWTGHKLDEVAMNRKEFTLPIGHVFNRLSGDRETEFDPITYTTASKEDFARYVAGFREEVRSTSGTIFNVEFKAKKEVKVPSINTVLDTLKEVYQDKGMTLANENALSQYKYMVGGHFNSSWFEKGLVNKLVSKGYNALVDDLDAGVFGDLPLIILIPDDFTSKNTTEMSMEQMDKLIGSITELKNRKL